MCIFADMVKRGKTRYYLKVPYWGKTRYIPVRGYRSLPTGTAGLDRA